MEIGTDIVRLRLAETFVIARESSDWDDVVQVELRHGGHVGRGEAAPIERYGETPESALAFVEEHGSLVGDDPFALEEIGARLGGDPRASRRQRPRSTARCTISRASCSGCPSGSCSGCRGSGRRRRGRSGSATPTTWPGAPRTGRRPVQAAQAQARRRRRPRRRACPRRPLAHRPAVAGRRQRVVVARRGARGDPAARRARRRLRRAAASRRRSRRGRS